MSCHLSLMFLNYNSQTEKFNLNENLRYITVKPVLKKEKRDISQFHGEVRYVILKFKAILGKPNKSIQHFFPQSTRTKGSVHSFPPAVWNDCRVKNPWTNTWKNHVLGYFDDCQSILIIALVIKRLSTQTKEGTIDIATGTQIRRTEWTKAVVNCSGFFLFRSLNSRAWAVHAMRTLITSILFAEVRTR